MAFNQRGFVFPSAHWFEDIKILALNLQSYLTNQKGARFLTLDMKHLSAILSCYKKNMFAFKQKIYGKASTSNNIDHHKIAAIYVKAILETQPFTVPRHIKKEIMRVELLANEFFCIALIEAILKAWDEDGTNKFLQIPPHQKSWLIKLLYQYHHNPGTLHILSLSQIIYYIELNFFR